MIILSSIYYFLINCKFCRNQTDCLILFCFGVLNTKFIEFYWIENDEYISEDIASKNEIRMVSDDLKAEDNDMKGIKRKTTIENPKTFKRRKLTRNIIVSTVEYFLSIFKKLIIENNDEHYTLKIEVKDFTYEDFNIFLSYYKTFYFPFSNFYLCNFILFLNIFEYLDISIDENFYKIVDLFLFQLCDLVKNKSINLEEEISQQKNKPMFSKHMVKIIFERFYKNYISLKSENLELLENIIKDLLLNKYDVELINSDLGLVSVSDDLIDIFEIILKKNHYCQNMFYLIFSIFDIKKVIFHRLIINLHKINNIVEFVLENIDEVVFYNMLIKDETIEFLNNNLIFNNLKHIHFINTKIISKNTFSDNLLSNKNIQAVIQVLKYKIENNFKENISRLIIQERLTLEKCLHYTFTKNTKLKTVNDLIFFRKEIFKIVIFPKASLSLELLSFIDILPNLKSIEINLSSLKNEITFVDQRYLFKNIIKISFKRCLLTKTILETIVILPDIQILVIEYYEFSFPLNNTIREFDLTHDFINTDTVFLLFLKSFKKIECLSFVGENLFKKLFFNDFTEYISNSELKSFSIISEYCIATNNFSFSCETLQDLQIGNKFTCGTLNSIFSNPKTKGLQKFSIFDCFIDKTDSFAFKNLNNLVDLEIENFNLENIYFHDLFSPETEYVIIELNLSSIKISRNDIQQICKFKHLKRLNLNDCKFEYNTFDSIKRFHLSDMENFNIVYINLEILDLDTNSLIEELGEYFCQFTMQMIGID
ncbi:hypothetical protein CWI38_0123p0070 [Hamiltosporidium tvaerminnensis]|uniref:Uncharacterized protein n=1 Tax=Hamiltosporidium tvaerminnensis TaxID=1176355 RepID=A0A4Q9M3R1_9MICR|nr:hypothetical protein CWI38_0123p0070 [Hamiltosporidium tvaerminnensis]